jgi:peptide deformylase
LPARIVQHETDHLDGKLFIDHLPSVRREMVMRKVKKLNK